MKWKPVLLSFSMLISAFSALLTEAFAESLSLTAVNNQGQHVVLQGADRFEVSWHEPGDREGMYTGDSQPFLRDEQGNIYIIGADGAKSFDSYGQLRWEKSLSSYGGKQWSLLLGKDGTLYVHQGAEYQLHGETTNQTGYVSAINKNTGEQKWQYIFDNEFVLDVPLFYTAAGDAQGNFVMQSRRGIISVGPNGLNWTYTDLFPEYPGYLQSNGLTLDSQGNIYALIAPPLEAGVEFPSVLVCLDAQGKLLKKHSFAIPGLIWMRLHAASDGRLYGANFYDVYTWNDKLNQFVHLTNPAKELLKEMRLPHDQNGLQYKGHYKWDPALSNAVWNFPMDSVNTSFTLYTQSDDEGNVYFSDYSGNLISLDYNGNQRFKLQAGDTTMSDFPFVVTGDGTIYGYSVTMGVFRISEKGNQVKVYLNGERVQAPIEPEIVNGKTLVPLRAIFEGLHANVVWNAEDQTIKVMKESKVISLSIGETEAFVNGENVELPVAPRIVSNFTLVPLRFISESLGAQVEWDSIHRVIRIQSNEVKNNGSRP